MLLDVIVELGEGLDVGKLSLGYEHAVLCLHDADKVHEAQTVELKCLIDRSIRSDGSLIDFKFFCQF